MKNDTLGQFVLTQDETLKFSQASGDFNPLHIDTVLARRYQFGSTVIHGVCGTLKSLDILLGHLNKKISIKKINVMYSKPIRHGDVVKVIGGLPEPGEVNIRLELYCNGRRSQVIKLIFGRELDQLPTVKDNKVDVDAEKFDCIDMLFEESLDLSEDVPLYWDNLQMLELFPNVYKFLPDYQSCIILGFTNIVGMKCPGLNSVFGGFGLSFNQSVSEFDPRLHFSISYSDDRFSRIMMNIKHNSAKGEIEAFFRAKPVKQPVFEEIQTLVNAKQFRDQTALIIGGSRGIGEIVSKLVAAGGGHSILSYSRGKDDAERIKSEILFGAGSCDIIHYDVLDAQNDIFMEIGSQKISHIYYFASPLIERSDAILFNDKLFHRFCDFYLTGLTNLLEMFVLNSEYRKGRIEVFIPSTVFLDDPPDGFVEYIAAKAAVEAFALQFGKKYSGWRIATPRLPRVLTDQTASIEKNSPMKTAEVILENLYRLYC